MVQLARSLAVAWAKDNIQANAILPGWIDTPLSVKCAGDRSGAGAAGDRPHPGRRAGAGPQDFAGPAVFLASAASDFVNGAALTVDGAYSVKA